MALVLVGPKSCNPFEASYFERRVAQGMPKMRALGHLCGKISHVIFAMLRDGVHYDARSHAAVVGVEWDDRFSRRSRNADPSAYEAEAEAMATGDGTEDPSTADAGLEPEE